MQKNWYVVYTKPLREKKVAFLLTKKKIENFCPMNCIEVQSFRGNKIIEEPLFKSCVFVYTTEKEVSLIRQTDEVINLLYWMGKPAVIKEDEIDVIREFTKNHHSVELERIQVKTHDIVRMVDGPTYSIDGKVFSMKTKIMRVNLPSMGYIMAVRLKDENIFAKETTILQNNSFSHS